jgi:hypothetical protein
VARHLHVTVSQGRGPEAMPFHHMHRISVDSERHCSSCRSHYMAEGGHCSPAPVFRVQCKSSSVHEWTLLIPMMLLVTQGINVTVLGSAVSLLFMMQHNCRCSCSWPASLNVHVLTMLADLAAHPR